MRTLSMSLAILLCTFATNVFAQSFTGPQKTQGYADFGDKITFIFDEALYGIKPQEKVTVTGEFRGWDADMDNQEWQLKKTGEAWMLTIDNADFGKIKPNTEFKFRVDDGAWIDPADGIDNVRNGNLVFMIERITKSLRAELRSDRLIWAEIQGDRVLVPSEYKIFDSKGKEIKVAGVLPNESRSTLIVPAEELDKRRVYYLEIPALGLRAECSYDGWFRELYSTKELGANIDNDTTAIRIFSPRADLVKLYLYKGRYDENAYETIEMAQDKDGVWETIIPENLHGIYYDFTVHGAVEKGNNFYESIPVHISDPYTRVSDNTFGKGRIWERTTPASPLKNGIPAMEDVISYEVHVQDFTDQLPVSDDIKGRFPAMIKSGLKNDRGEKIGFDYLVDLGINTVHLMPVQEYLHFPDEDWKASFKDDPYMIEQGISEENYQWGYRTSHAFAVESKYRTKGKEPGEERDEFRDLVQAFHDKDIAVIIDIVPNHTHEDMASKTFYHHFNVLDKQYYYRTKDYEHIGAYGNEVKTEDRPMTQRWLIEQCQYYINEFGIDGFRIDLAGQIDEQTLKALKDALGHDKIIYGEAWIASNDPNYENNPDWDWYKEDAPITFFQDDSRGAYKGPVFELKDKAKHRGWAGGKFDERDNVMLGLAAKFKDDKTPNSGITYLDIHDNFALADQFGSKDFDGRYGVDQDEYKIATTLMYTTLGPIVTHGGSEIMRSKAHAPLMEVEKETKEGYKVYMHGFRDSYNHRIANQFVWSQVGQKPQEGNTNDYANMHAYWKGMNEFRLSEYGEVFRVADAVSDDYYQFFTPESTTMLGYLVDEKVFVLLNAGQEAGTFENITLPEGKWKLIANTKEIDHKKGIRDSKDKMKLKTGQAINIDVEPTSVYIWVKQ
ncbi:pullulanase/glycogen debranching enzyme [Sediminitomix flava]|uniref:Pullulanase/glycogen debranching enzyme n=2 Tax=Sediminitomix flava TaxID=379075 RepID=A0A315Z7G0_SEDFL|nr:pullulanase/glycogen debranching enzyme [Sediminitomix flava]